MTKRKKISPPIQNLNCGVPANELDNVFPFHFAVNIDLKLIQHGRALTKLCPKIKNGRLLSKFFKITSPKINADFHTIIEQIHGVFLLEYLHDKINLKGQFLPLRNENAEDILLFIGSPVVRDLGRLQELGLTLNDFAVHDPILDLLILLQAKNNTINDSQKMAEKLKDVIITRRQAELELQHINEKLESIVQARTQELEQANQDLHTSVELLQKNNRELSILNRMGDQLQVCHNIDKALKVITRSMRELFPDTSGMLALRGNDEEHFPIHLTWGETNLQTEGLNLEKCWALKRSHTHHGNEDEQDLLCGSLDKPHTCVPLHAQKEMLGVIHIQWPSQNNPLDMNQKLRSEEQEQLLVTASEHIGLALANLRLRESLRQQSLRDPLTDLYNRRHMEEALKRETSRARRQSHSMGIIMVDVDHFKRFNDEHGHEAGDRLLQKLGDFLKQHIRAEDIPCRYGGEEFTLILPEASREDTMARAELLRHEAADELQIRYEGKTLGPVTLSLGVASYPDNGKSGKKVVKSADKALYEAKQSGRNCVVLSQAK